jgi:hypothetical protein
VKTRCALCGQFMCDDDVLLGMTSTDGEKHIHANCARKYVERGDAVEHSQGIALVKDKPRANDWQNAHGSRWL